MRHEKEPRPDETKAPEEVGAEAVPAPAEPIRTESAEVEHAKPAEPEKPKATEPEKVYVGTGISWAIIFGVILIAFIAVLAWQNTGTTTVNLLFWKVEAPLISVILGVAAVTVIIDELIGMILRLRKRRILKQKEELKKLKKGPR